MTTQDIRKVTTPAQMEAIYPVMKELRLNLSFERFCELTHEAAKHDGYELFAVFQNNRCVAAMGQRILYDFVHGKHLYIDDLVVTKDCRSQGLGARLLKLAEETAKEKGCDGLRLCTGVENEAGKRFYEREGWTARALAFKKKL